jgi:hypothetical protein
MMVSVKPVSLNRSQLIISDCPLEWDWMKGQSCTWGAEMGGMITSFWVPENSSHVLSSAQIEDILEPFE